MILCVTELNPIELLWGATKRSLRSILDGTHKALKDNLAPILRDVGGSLDYVRGWFIHVQRYVVAYSTVDPAVHTTLGAAFTAVRKLKGSHRTPTGRMEVLFGVPAAAIPATTRELFGVYLEADVDNDDGEEGPDPGAGAQVHDEDGPQDEDEDDNDDVAYAQAIAQAVGEDNAMMDTWAPDEEILENDDDDGSTSDRDDDYEE